MASNADDTLSAEEQDDGNINFSEEDAGWSDMEEIDDDDQIMQRFESIDKKKKRSFDEMDSDDHIDGPPTSIKRENVSLLCNDLKNNGFNVEFDKQCSSNIHKDLIDDIPSNYVVIIKEFVNHSLFSAIVVSSQNVFEKLAAFANSLDNIRDDQIYFTMNANDFLSKQKKLFKSGAFKNEQFWGEFKEKYSSFIGSQLTNEAENELNEFHRETNKRLIMEKRLKSIATCCIAISLYKEAETRDKIAPNIEKFGLNHCAKKQYQLAIERACKCIDILYDANYASTEHGVMDSLVDVIWSYMGERTTKQIKICEFSPSIEIYTCEHCGKNVDKINVDEDKIVSEGKQSAETKKSKANNTDLSVVQNIMVNTSKHCHICKVSVQNNAESWKQHIEGEKHKKIVKEKYYGKWLI